MAFTPPFQLNRIERAALSSVIYDERRGPGGDRLKFESIDRYMRRYDSGENRPKKGSNARKLIDAIYATDGLVVRNPAAGSLQSPACAAVSAVEDVAESALAAREMAADLIAQGEIIQAFHKGDEVPGCDVEIEESEELWGGVVVSVTINRQNAGDTYYLYNLEEGEEEEFDVERFKEVYTLEVTRLWVFRGAN